MTALAHHCPPPVELHLPLPPSTNRCWRAVRGRVVLAGAVHRFRREVDNAVQRAGCPSFGAAPVVVSAEVTPSPAGMDADNGLKTLLDALTKSGVWADDRQVGELHVWRTPPGAAPGVRVTVEASVLSPELESVA